MDMQALSSMRSSLKQKLQNREKVLAVWTSLAHPSISELFTSLEVDFLGIDIEHSTISQEQSQRIIAASHANHCLCLPRVATHNMEMIKRLLDSGADGVIVPMVSTVEQVQQIIRWVKYPPVGERGFGIARAQGYGLHFDHYIKAWNAVSSVIIQIESIQAVDDIEALLAFDEIDGVMIGPYDISGSLGIPGQIHHAKVQAACDRVIEACARFNKSCGTQLTTPDQDNVAQAYAQGFTFVVLASDIFILWKWAENMKNVIDWVQA